MQFANEPNVWLVASSQAFLIPCILWYPQDKLLSFICAFVWATSTWFHTFPTSLSHTIDRVAINLSITHSVFLVYQYSPYSLVWVVIPHIYNYTVFVYGRKHQIYFFDTDLRKKTIAHAGVHLISAGGYAAGALINSRLLS
jgi:hypothetical protein